MKKQAIEDQIKQNNKKLQSNFESRVKSRKKNFSCDFVGCYPLFVQEWFGRYDSKVYNGQCLQLNFNQNFTKWNSGKNAPQWFFWALVKNGENVGECDTFTHNGAKYKPDNIQVRNVGITGKARICGVIKKKIDNGPWQLLA